MSRKRALIDSDDDSSDSDGDDLEEQLLSLSKKSKKEPQKSTQSPSSDSSDDNKQNKDEKDENSDSSTDNSDDEWTLDNDSKTKKKTKKAKPSKANVSKSTVSDDDSDKEESEEEEGEINDDDDEDDDDKNKNNTQMSDDEEGEEGEISSSSSSDDEGSDEELPAFDDGLDDNLVGDDEDRRKLESMTEVEREKELFNRMEKREAMKTRLEIERKLHGERKKERKKHKKDKDRKPKASDSSTEGVYGTIASRKSERKRTVEDNKKKAMELIQQKRFEKKEKMEAIMSKKEPLTTKDVYSDDEDDDDNDGDGDKDDDDDDSDKSSVEFGSDDDEEEEKEDVKIEKKEEIEQIRLSRHKLEQWVHLPFFSRVISGCYVRMGIGNHEGRPIYRVVEIIDVTETPKVYTLGKTRTNKGIKVRHGMQERVFRMEYVSNQPFSESEFQKWKEEMRLVELPLPTAGAVKAKSLEIRNSKQYSYKDEDIEAIVREKRKFRKNPHNYAVTKNRLIREKEIAEQTNDMTELSKVKEQLEELEERAQILDKQRSGALSNVSFINERNRKKNVYDAEKAAIEEGLENKFRKDDPFTRRKTMPKMITKSAAQVEAEKAAAAAALAAQMPASSDNNEDEERGEQAAESSDINSLLFNKVPLPSSDINPTGDSDLFSAHDFDVQIDVAVPETRTMSITPKPMVHHRENVSRRSLNLDEYKKRKGLM